MSSQRAFRAPDEGNLGSLSSGCDHVYFSVARLPDFIPDAVRQIVGVDRQLLPHALHLLCRAVAGRKTMPLAPVALQGEKTNNCCNHNQILREPAFELRGGNRVRIVQMVNATGRSVALLRTNAN